MGNKRYFHYMRKSLKESTIDRLCQQSMYMSAHRLLYKIVGLPDNERKVIVKLFTGAKFVLNHYMSCQY
jgi:hypothetical protein